MVPSTLMLVVVVLIVPRTTQSLFSSRPSLAASSPHPDSTREGALLPAAGTLQRLSPGKYLTVCVLGSPSSIVQVSARRGHGDVALKSACHCRPHLGTTKGRQVKVRSRTATLFRHDATPDMAARFCLCFWHCVAVGRAGHLSPVTHHSSLVRCPSSVDPNHVSQVNGEAGLHFAVASAVCLQCD